jgi:hypothetical protein
MLGTSTFETRGRFRFQDEVTTPDVPEGCPSLSFGYLPPTSIEILPLAILTEASQELITEIAGGPEDLGITIFQTASIITWSTWVSISRAFSELALDMIGRVPFYAVEPSRCPPFTNNTPYERVEEWQRIVPDDLDELEGMIPIEDKLRWIQIRLRRAIELEGRDARAQALVIRIRNLTRLGLPTAAEERERVLTELSAGEAAELLLLQQDRPRLLNLRETLLDARGRGGFAGIVERIDDRWPFIVDWLGCKASWPISQLCWWSLVACGFHQVPYRRKREEGSGWRELHSVRRLLREVAPRLTLFPPHASRAHPLNPSASGSEHGFVVAGHLPRAHHPGRHPHPRLHLTRAKRDRDLVNLARSDHVVGACSQECHFDG